MAKVANLGSPPSDDPVLSESHETYFVRSRNTIETSPAGAASPGATTPPAKPSASAPV
jgi:hypothetical protein